MTDTPATPAGASAVIIGAGIVGNSLVHHLASLGWRDLVLVDQGPMPNPGGSTGHASNFIFPIEYSKMMFDLTTRTWACSPRAAASRWPAPRSG
jgi:glycine/D-amino acid oxidase-like deaminating enzyme